MDNELEKKVDSIFSLWQRDLCPGGQVKIRKAGELIYDKCFGYANLEHKLPITHETVFHVASVSKQVTVMCALLLHEDGKIHVDDDIREYIQDLVPFHEPVSIRNMMNNVSGIRDQWELLVLRGVRIDDTITQEDAKALISSQTALNFPPLSRYLYSNSNFTLLAEIVERVSGKTLNEFADERIFTPLGMKNTCFKDRYWQLVPNRAGSYKDNGTEFVHAVLNYGAYGATSLNTTASDFLKWMDNYKKPMICKKETLALMFECPTLTDGTLSRYAGGLEISDPTGYKGHAFFNHGGADAAFRSHMTRFTEDDLDIVIFSNTQNIVLKLATEKIADIVLGLEVDETADMPLFYCEDFEEADATGIYFAPGEELFYAEVISKDGRLVMEEAYGPSPLIHSKGNCYQVGHLDFKLYLGKKSGCKIGPRLIPLVKWCPTPEKSENLVGYAGKYESTEIETSYYVTEEDGYLYFSHIRNGKNRLLNIGPDQFMVGGTQFLTPGIISFTRGSGGKVTGCSISTGRVKNLAFAKTGQIR